MPTAVIIGAGHNGLVAAFYLARAGVDVTVLERRDSVGGLCATEEIFPGIRGNFCANSAHNLEPKVLADMQLERHGLSWSEPLEPNSFIMFPGGRRIVSWPDESDLAAEYDRFSRGEYARHKETLEEMADLGRALDVSFFEAPPSFGELASTRMTWQQQEVFRRVMFGSAAEVVSLRLKSEEARTSLGMLAAAGNFIGPATPGSGYQLMQRALYRGSRVMRDRPKVKATADFNSRAALGGMGAITAAMASAVRGHGATIRTGVEVVRILVSSDMATGVVLDSGEELVADVVVSAVNPKLTMIDLVDSADLPPDARDAYSALEMTGCMGKVYLELEDLPDFACASSAAENDLLVKCGFRIGDTVDEMQRSYERARRGDWRGSPIIYGLTQTAFDPTLTRTGRHLMSLSVTYAPYDVDGGWESNRDAWGAHVIATMRQHIRNLDDILRDHRVMTTADLEQEFGLLEGNALHGDVTVPHMFDWRPIPGYSDYTTPVGSLYLCSNGTWPANYVSGLPGHNAAHKIVADLAPRM
jgi:phytoene dehydrogenase-like protein